ncbi:serine hydrolase domain-containing protein [Roseivirga sp.]|uniref:serine hydrolase domain-containing protein n=1 Tax=Roseivirga sp. TaxID=1964215 RepID=UPI003B51DD4B
MRRPGIFILFLIHIISALSLPLSAQDKSDQIDKIFSWVGENAPGCVCAFSRNGQVEFTKAYGLANLETQTPLEANSVLDAGSLVKQFVAATALMMVEEGTLSLSADIHDYIPELPDYGYTININHLMTHTSGIRDWTGLRMISSQDEDALTMTLQQQGLNFPPGEQWSYSNSGYVLLKEIIARVTGKPFGEVAQQKLFEPLNMSYTIYTETPSTISERALAYEKRGESWQKAVLEDNDRGGGGALMTTAGDLLIWNDALTQKKLGAFVSQKLQEPVRLNNGRKLTYARGLFNMEMDLGQLIWHGGSAGGYKSLLGRLPEFGFSIAIMCNSGEQSNRTLYANRIFRLYLNEDQLPAPETQDTSIEIPEETLQAKTGSFVNETNTELIQVVSRNGRLGIPGGPMLNSIDNNTFANPEGMLEFHSEDAFKIKYLSDDQFILISMEGERELYNRVMPFEPKPEDLKPYEGKYHSDDMAATFNVQATPTGILMFLEHAPMQKIPFQPINSELFNFRRMQVRFLSNSDGELVALEYSNPILSRVKFKRIE